MAKFLTTCDNLKCKKQFLRIRNQHIKFHCHYCSRSCAASVNNTKFPKRIAKIKQCLICGRNFTENKAFCSKKCQGLSYSLGREEISSWINHFYHETGRIPLKRECPHEKAARKVFGSWNKAIIAAGLTPNPVMFSKKFIANDGHKCDSLAEKIIDDWFNARKIPHQIHVRYERTKFTTDFLVGETYVEFFGLEGQLKRYDKLIERKLQLIKDRHLKFVSVHPSDLFPKSNLDTLLGHLQVPAFV